MLRTVDYYNKIYVQIFTHNHNIQCLHLTPGCCWSPEPGPEQPEVGSEAGKEPEPEPERLPQEERCTGGLAGRS